MRLKSWRELGLIACVVFSVSLATSAAAEGELFVVAASLNGDANYMISNGDGTFSSQHILQVTGNCDDIDLPYKFSFGNGLGDFDNDGDLDYIMGMGYGSGNIYISEKLENSESEYFFGPPAFAAAWGEEGYMPMDMAVADFDADGNADFIMSIGSTTTTMLYLGDGALGFRSFIIPNSQPYSSSGADAADFNNDGLADFVVGPAAAQEKFYVNLAKEDGTFDLFTFDTYDGNAVYGVAAADFNGDGNVDIAAAAPDYLAIYKGFGDGTFEFFSGYEFELNRWSALDNFDFDGDGKQDLIANNYGSNPAGVAVLLGNGDGTFTLDDIYLGGTVGERIAVTAPPYEPNQAPIAVIEPAYLEATVGEEIVFDGSYSHDGDGEIVAYEWDFGDEKAPDSAVSLMPVVDAGAKVHEASASHVYYQTGTYTVTLTVTDDKGADNVIQAKVNVNPVKVKVKFSPTKLNLKSRDKWIVATINLPDGMDGAPIDFSTLRLTTPNGTKIPAFQEYRRGFLAKLWRKIQRRMNVVVVKFDRQAVIAAIDGPSDNTVLTVSGKLPHKVESLEFIGSGTIKTYERAQRLPWHFF